MAAIFGEVLVWKGLAEVRRSRSMTLTPMGRKLTMFQDVNSVESLKQQEQVESATIHQFRLAIRPEEDALQRSLAHMTGQALTLATQIYFAMQAELNERPDRLAAFQEWQPLINMLLQLQRQGERNQQLASRLSTEPAKVRTTPLFARYEERPSEDSPH
jgi:hypothetical protein